MKAGTCYSIVDSPVGKLLLAGSPAGLGEIRFLEGRPRDRGADPAWVRSDQAMRQAAGQLAEYFAGMRRRFDLRIAPRGTPFQLRVWHALAGIPYGDTESYGALARRIGSKGAARAVGAANGQNPIPIVLPCHRVIGADGSLTGYGGGLDIKRVLLALEAH